ncbi:5-hydroxytryptamine receptor 3A-like [Labrus mixtus]|uniref:5-hydroxytryptamine receptor 3A-like n=1 Tax=Labrus mixtus TaxID=508554 RepID=UPI0029BFBAD0|nr:5-hydroxytryptamine receptor 3A-like [Labrus mixtus]
MMLAGFLLIILLQGGFTSDHTEQPELDQQKANQSYEKGGSTFNYTEPTNITQNANQSSVEDGITFNNTETTNITQNTNQSSVEDGASTCNKTYQDLVEYLNLTSKKGLNTMTRPAKNDSKPTEIHLDLALYAILDVREKEQTFMSYVWVEMIWNDEYIRWDPSNFCGITQITLPSKQLWLPDLTIEEMTEKDKTTQSPYLRVFNDGEVVHRNDMVLVTTCKMDVYKFPFDIQSCNLTFKSIIHNVKEIKLEKWGGSRYTTEWSKKIMRTQSDWDFININVTDTNVYNFYINQSIMVYTVNMKRRSVLYIVNFILPVLLFLCLDLASFMISENGGEKLSFKVTVLLAVTVMQLILNEILPSSSNRIPLIAMYCIGIFGLMMLSLLETIFVMYLIEKDSASQNDWTDKEQSLSEDCKDKRGKNKFHTFLKDLKKRTNLTSACAGSSGERPSEMLPVSKETSSSQLTEESNASETEMLQELSPPLSSRKEEGKAGRWTRRAKTVNKVFFIFYIITASLFLVFMFHSWNEQAEEVNPTKTPSSDE